MYLPHLSLFLFSLLLLPLPSISQDQQPDELIDLSNLVDMSYHNGPLLTSPINLYPIWYGQWDPAAQSIIRDFLRSLSSSSSLPSPSVADWWRTVTHYPDQSNNHVTSNLILAAEHFDSTYSQGNQLTRPSMELIIKAAISSSPDALPLDKNGMYLVFTSQDVRMEEFCRGVCGFHSATTSSTVGETVPFAWIGQSGTQCPGMCAFPFASPPVNPGFQVLGSPNGDPGTDGMISVIAQALAEASTNPYNNGWYAGDDANAPNEIGDLCEGVYGTGAGSGLIGKVYTSSDGSSYNVNGANGRCFLLQWIWDPVRNSCYGPNAVNS